MKVYVSKKDVSDDPVKYLDICKIFGLSPEPVNEDVEIYDEEEE